MKKITPYNVKRFAGYMERKYNVKIINKYDPRVLVIETMLKAMGVKHIDDWLDSWSMCVGKIIYLSFNPGVISPGKPNLARQVSIITHECVHAVQQRSARFWPRYLLRTDWRTKYEIAAVKAEWEVLAKLGGFKKTPWWSKTKVNPWWVKTWSKRLKDNYKIKSGDAKHAERVLSMYAKYINRGLTAQPVAKEALAWWRGERG
jgi:hypothetical protein